MESTWLIVTIIGGLVILVLLFCFFWKWLGNLINNRFDNILNSLIDMKKQNEQLIDMLHDEILVTSLRKDLTPDDLDDKKYIDTIARSLISETGVWTFGVNLEKRGYVNYERPGNIDKSKEQSEE